MDPTHCPPFIHPDVWKRIAYHAVTRKAIEYLEHSIGDTINLKGVSAAACMETTAFAKAFRRSTGMTFMNFAQAYKVSLVSTRLQQSDDSISVIANECGFNSLVTLERTFKKLVGQTPSHYRADFLLVKLHLVNKKTTAYCHNPTTNCQPMKSYAVSYDVIKPPDPVLVTVRRQPAVAPSIRGHALRSDDEP